MQPIRIDTSQIPAATAQMLGATFLAAVKKFYQNPENVKKFEEWKRQNNTDNKT